MLATRKPVAGEEGHKHHHIILDGYRHLQDVGLFCMGEGCGAKVKADA